MAADSESQHIDALRAATDDAEQRVTTEGFDRHALGVAADHLRACLEVVLERHADALRTDAALQALVVRARSVHTRVRSVTRAEPASSADAGRKPLSPEQSRAVIDRHRLRRCRECDGDVLLVRDDVVLGAYGESLRVVVVACGRCGDVRLRMLDGEALARALVDGTWQVVTMPGSGPFRSG